MGYIPNIPHLYVGYSPFTNHLLTSWDIQVGIVAGLWFFDLGDILAPGIPNLHGKAMTKKASSVSGISGVGFFPLPGCQWQMKVYRDSLQCYVILLVTGILGGQPKVYPRYFE